MNQLIQPKKLTMFIVSALVCFALCPMTQAVVPAPDGGYPGGNTAEGGNALFSLTTGVYNTALGLTALFHDTDGDFNTDTAAGALFSNNGNRNTANGINALRFNTAGDSNTAMGTNALYHNNTASNNTAVGDSALFSNTTGVQNTAVGYQALFSTVGSFGGFSNTATGYQALFSNLEGDSNTATGVNALFSNSTGGSNVASGRNALANNTVGFVNTATGVNALFSNTTGSNNVATGRNALGDNISGLQNTANGYFALSHNTTGSGNIALGNNAGANLTTGDSNIDIGNEGVAAESNTIRIGMQGTQTATFIAGIFGTTLLTGTPVVVNSAGQLGVAVMISSARFKDEIKPMDKASEAILALKPVTFHYKKEIDPDRTPQFGLVAEDVEKVNPDLVLRDKEARPYSVRYDQVNAMLLNEFLKEHRKVEELKSDFQATVAQQQKEIQALTAQLKEQAAQIQKVSAQLEVSRPAPQAFVNNQ